MTRVEKRQGNTSDPLPPELHFENSAGRGQAIYDALEAPNWAPWLRFSALAFDGQAQTFPEGQLLLVDGELQPIASLSTNRIKWDGDPRILPTWTQMAGEDMSYGDTYQADGNVLVLMSVNIRHDAQGLGLTDQLVSKAKEVANSLGIEHVMSDFRPSGYGAYKAEVGDPGFATYCELVRGDGMPVDPWLRSLAHRGMTPIRPDFRASIIPVAIQQFVGFKKYYKPESWYALTDPNLIKAKIAEHNPQTEIGHVNEVWECRETGTWYVNRNSGQAVYIEGNLWGELPRP